MGYGLLFLCEENDKALIRAAQNLLHRPIICSHGLDDAVHLIFVSAYADFFDGFNFVLHFASPFKHMYLLLIALLSDNNSRDDHNNHNCNDDNTLNHCVILLSEFDGLILMPPFFCFVPKRFLKC